VIVGDVGVVLVPAGLQLLDETLHRCRCIRGRSTTEVEGGVGRSRGRHVIASTRTEGERRTR
jgi:hypothetical protein